MRNPGSGTTVKPNSANDHVFVISAPRQNIHLHDLKIKLDTQPVVDGTGNGVHCLTTAGNKVTEVRIERVLAMNLGNDGFHFEGANFSDAAVGFLTLRDCEAVTCRGSGAYVKNCTASSVQGGYYNGNRRFGLYCDAAGAIRLFAVSVENNQAAGTNAAFDTQIRLRSSHGFSLIGAHIEEFDNNALAKTAVTVENCFGGYVGSCFLGNASGVAASRGIFIVTSSRAIVVGPNHWNYVDTLIEINAADNNTDCIVLPQAPQNTDANSAATIILPDADGNGNFAFVPTTKLSNVGAGLLLPRITSATRDAIPAGILQRGLVVYNSTTNKLNFYDGTAWRVVTST